MVIRHIGVTAFGVPIYFKHFGETSQDKEMLFSALIEAFNAIGDQLELGRIDTVAFGENLLHVTPTRKGYRVIAISDTKEWYVRNLVKRIAEIIDSDENIPEPTGFVDDEIVSKIKNLLDKFIIEEVSVSPEDIFKELDTTVKELSEILGKDAVRNLDKTIAEKRKKISESWSNILASIEGNIYEALENAWRGEISTASAIILKRADTPLLVSLGIRLSLLSNLFHNLISPPLDLIKQLVNYLTEDDVFVALIRRAVDYHFYWMDVRDYFSLYMKALEKFDTEEGVETQIKALILFDEMLLRVKSDKAKKLLNYYKDTSDALYTYFEVLAEKNVALKRIFNADLGEAQHLISVWSQKLFGDIKLTNKFLGWRTREYVLDKEEAVEAMKVFFRTSVEAEIYAKSLSYITRHLSTDAETKLRVLSQALDLIDKLLNVINREFPIYIPSCVEFMKEISFILEYSIRIIKQKNISNITEAYKKLLAVCGKIAIDEYDKMIRFYPWITSVLASFSSILLYLDDYHPQILELFYLISRLISLDSLEGMKKSSPDMFTSFVSDLLFTFGYVLVRRGVEQNKDHLESIIDYLIELVKWKMFRGSASVIDVLRIISLLSRTVFLLPKSKVKHYNREIASLLELFIDDPAKRESELVVLSEELVMFYKRLSDVVGKDAEIMSRINEMIQQLLRILGRKNYQQKIKKIETVLQGKIKESSILELF